MMCEPGFGVRVLEEKYYLVRELVTEYV